MVTQEMIDESWRELISVMQYLSFRQGDKSDLEKVVAMAEELDLDKYLDEGKDAFEAALSNAQAVLADENAMQDSVDPAWRELLKAMSELRLKPDKSALEELIAQAQGLNEADYEETSFRAMLSVLAEVQTVYDDSSAAQDEIDAAAEKLQAALDGLTAKADAPADTDGSQNAGEAQDTAGGEKQAGAGSGKADESGESKTAAGKAVKTGDTFTYMLWAAAVLAAGAVILLEKKKQK